MIFLYKNDYNYYSKLSKATGFHKDVIEKVHRLIKILIFINNNAFLKDRLVLKGGTALNLVIFKLPRLSVDIDLDFHSYQDKEKVMKEREKVKTILFEYLDREGYSISEKSKQYYSLESIVASYINNVGNKDNLKIEINYSLRHHINSITNSIIDLKIFDEKIEVRTLEKIELISTKTVALYNRLAARDFYDIFNLNKNTLISNNEHNFFTDCFIFYYSISANKVDNFTFSTQFIDAINQRTIMTDLYPMLVKGEKFNLKKAKEQVKEFLERLINIKIKHKEYLTEFAKGNYRPELLFEGETLKNIEKHPMAIWKTSRN
jgi:predicted nucleotidyltransferase component of viral defense system